MGFYEFLVNTYDRFVGIFPPQLQWLVTLLILIGMISALIGAFKRNWIAIVVVIVLLPFLIPVLQRFLGDIYQFFLYLLEAMKLTTPR